MRHRWRTSNSAVTDPIVWSCILLFLCTLDVTQSAFLLCKWWCGDRDKHKLHEGDVGAGRRRLASIQLFKGVHCPSPITGDFSKRGRCSPHSAGTAWHCGAALHYRKRGSASYIVREVLSVRERERYRERRKWRHHCRAKIGDEFTPTLAKNSHKWRRVYTFPCQKFALFVSPFTLPVSPFLNGHHCGAEIRNEFTLPLPKNFSLLVRNLNRKLALVGKFL